MNPSELKKIIELNIKPEFSFNNPGRGRSTIVKITSDKICYKRGRSRFYLAYEDMCKAYIHFLNQEVTTKKLKKFSPSIYDSYARPSGHNCNCTFLFLILNHVGLASNISGKGVAGNLFKCKFLQGT